MWRYPQKEGWSVRHHITSSLFESSSPLVTCSFKGKVGICVSVAPCRARGFRELFSEFGVFSGPFERASCQLSHLRVYVREVVFQRTSIRRKMKQMNGEGRKEEHGKDLDKGQKKKEVEATWVGLEGKKRGNRGSNGVQ